MKARSFFSIIAIALVLCMAILVRFYRWENSAANGYNATSWDALGYYMYLPGFLIYDDVKELEWLPQIDSTYHVTGGNLYQANKTKNGNYVFKYLGGVSIMQLPFFCIGHVIAKYQGVPQDGFSWPYQYAILWGAISWFLMGLLFLRKALLHFFSDTVTGLTILLLFLATNLPQYISIDGAMSHSFIFPLYGIMLWLTIRWHDQPSATTALLIGLTCGLATISRPTELIMLFIPLLWGCQTKAHFQHKRDLVKQHLSHVLLACAGALVGVLPQLLYWHYTTGSFLYDVGSKWFFLNPWFRVLFGFHSGWFIYTPIALFYIAGFWFMRKQPFQKSIIAFCLLNIWIVIAWSDWKYGISYAGRAFSQGTPVYAFALASIISAFYVRHKRYVVLAVGMILIAINVYHFLTFNTGIFHHFSLLEKLWKGF